MKKLYFTFYEIMQEYDYVVTPAVMYNDLDAYDPPFNSVWGLRSFLCKERFAQKTRKFLSNGKVNNLRHIKLDHDGHFTYSAVKDRFMKRSYSIYSTYGANLAVDIPSLIATNDDILNLIQTYTEDDHKYGFTIKLKVKKETQLFGYIFRVLDDRFIDLMYDMHIMGKL